MKTFPCKYSEYTAYKVQLKCNNTVIKVIHLDIHLCWNVLFKRNICQRFSFSSPCIFNAKNYPVVIAVLSLFFNAAVFPFALVLLYFAVVILFIFNSRYFLNQSGVKQNRDLTAYAAVVLVVSSLRASSRARMFGKKGGGGWGSLLLSLPFLQSLSLKACSRARTSGNAYPSIGSVGAWPAQRFFPPLTPGNMNLLPFLIGSLGCLRLLWLDRLITLMFAWLNGIKFQQKQERVYQKNIVSLKVFGGKTFSIDSRTPVHLVKKKMQCSSAKSEANKKPIVTWFTPVKFPRLALISCFPALGTVCTFSGAWHSFLELRWLLIGPLRALLHCLSFVVIRKV